MTSVIPAALIVPLIVAVVWMVWSTYALVSDSTDGAPPSERPIHSLPDKPSPDKPLPDEPSVLATNPLEISPNDDELTRLLKSRHNAVAEQLEGRVCAWKVGGSTRGEIKESVDRLLHSKLELAETPAEEITVLEEQLEFAQWIETAQEERFKVGRLTRTELAEARYWRADAEAQVLRAQRKGRSSHNRARSAQPSDGSGRGDTE